MWVNILTLSLVCGNTAIPFLWRTLNRKGNSTLADKQTLLGRYLRLFGVAEIDYLCADREFDGYGFVPYLEREQVPFRLRVKVQMQWLGLAGPTFPARHCTGILAKSLTAVPVLEPGRIDAWTRRKHIMNLRDLALAFLLLCGLGGAAARRTAFYVVTVLLLLSGGFGTAQGQCNYTITVTNPGTTYQLGSPGYLGVFTQTGGIGAVTFSLNSGTLPNGFAIAANGSVSGNTQQGGSFTFSVKVTDSNGCVGVGQNITITNSSLGDPDYAAMIALRDTYGWGNTFAWPLSNPCPNSTEEINWNGVTCVGFNGQLRVTIIIASCGGIKLNPPFPNQQIETLNRLNSLDVRNCFINGQIPATTMTGLDALTEITRLRIDNNPAMTGNLSDVFPGGLNTTRFPRLTSLDTSYTNLGGQIPAGVFGFPNSQLVFSLMRLNGTLPAAPTALAPTTLGVNGNALEGVVPDYIRNAATNKVIYLRYNKFDTANTPAGNIDTIDPLWRTTQTVPPTNVQVAAAGAGTAQVSWTPIAYTAHGGYYEVFSSQTAGGPYVSRGTTSATGGKTASSLTVSGLPAGTNYFVVRTFTPAHVSTPVNRLTDNPNDLTSANSAETSASVAAPIIVTKTADTNGTCNSGVNCSLREAIAAAPSGDSITFAAPLFDSPQTVTLTLGQLTVPANKSISVTGRAANLTSISGAIASRVFEITTGGSLTLNNLTVTGGNTASYGAGIYNHGGLFLNNVAVRDNAATLGGAGIAADNNSTNEIYNSTVSGNTATGGNGGGVFVFFTATANFVNSTVSGNSSSATGGGIVNDSSPLQLRSVTVAGNAAQTGGGIAIYNSATANALNAIIGGNTASGSAPDFFGTLTSQGFNLIGSTSGATVSGTTTGNILNQSPRLAPLGFYGGNTMTHALLSNSPALNATALPSNLPAADQRGTSRVGNVDLGAFELSNAANGGNYRALLPRGTQGMAYNNTLVPDTGAFTYTQTGGALPPGLSLGSSFAAPEGGSRSLRAAAVTLAGTPMQSGTYNFTLTASDGVNSNATDYQLDVLGPTAAGVPLSGYVLTHIGRAPRGAIVTLTDLFGQTQTTPVNRFGYYSFTEVAAGRTYFVTVEAKGYTFMPPTAIVTLNFEVQDVNFTAFAIR